MAQTVLERGDRVPDIEVVKRDGTPMSLYGQARGGALAVLFYHDHADGAVAETLRRLASVEGLLEDAGVALFAVSGDTAEATAAFATETRPTYTLVGDPDHRYAAAYGATGRLVCYVLDPTQRVHARLEASDGPIVDRLLAAVEEVGPPRSYEAPPHAPILVIPNVLSPEDCRDLIAHFDAGEKSEGGTWRMVDGKLVNAPNREAKRRLDHGVTDPDMKARLTRLLGRRVIPEIALAFQHKIAHAEEFKIVRYDAADGGFFRPHRDNTVDATAHRQFAMTLNLNSEDYEGGELRFPEFGGASYKPPSGAAVVFSCSLMHEATPVTRGSRYVVLGFFYDSEGQRIRQKFTQSLEGAAS